MITVHRIADSEGFTQGVTIIIDDVESAKNFNMLIHRGTNLWPDAPAEIKELADQITNQDMLRTGQRGLQDYSSQDTSTKGKK